MLDYIALGILIFAGITLFYGIIVVHDIPYEIAVHRNHPHQDAIHYAGWVSLFTLHAIWPFLWIWSTLYREDRGWGFDPGAGSGTESETGALAAEITQADESEADITQPNAVQSVNAIEPVVDITETVVLLRHRLEALEDRLERIEQAILAATAAEPGDGGVS